MDAIARVATYFPSQSITSFWILSNLIINNEQQCDKQTRSLIIAILVLFCIFVVFIAFTNTYTASNNQKYIVLLLPFYGPVCMSLPTDLDKDRVYEHYYVKIRDYVRAVFSVTAFILIILFINPIVMCLFPSNNDQSLSRLSSSIIRTVPIVVAVITSLLMICLGPPRQSLGFQNVDETCPPLQKPTSMGDNPIYSNKHAQSYQQRQPRFSGGPDSDEHNTGDFEAGYGPPGSKTQMQMFPINGYSNGGVGSGARTPGRDSMASSRHVGPPQQDG